MKKVTLIVPDEIIHVIGTTSSSRQKKIMTDRKNIVQALETNDYHDNYYFPIGSVKVESVRQIKKGTT